MPPDAAAASLARAIRVLAGQIPGAAPVALGQLFGGKAEAPAVPPPVPMPDLTDPAALDAKKRVLDQAAGRSGRASTILSGADQDYSGSKLGVA